MNYIINFIKNQPEDPKEKEEHYKRRHEELNG